MHDMILETMTEEDIRRHPDDIGASWLEVFRDRAPRTIHMCHFGEGEIVFAIFTDGTCEVGIGRHYVRTSVYTQEVL